MTDYSYKLTGKAARASVAALAAHAPFYAEPQLADLLANMGPLGVRIQIGKTKPRHTDSQRGYYHLCVDKLAKHLGMTHDQMHDQALIEWGGSKQVQIGSKIGTNSFIRTVDVPLKRSANLTVEQYGELIEALLRISGFVGYPLPDPQEVA